jgi:hypothetical protein
MLIKCDVIYSQTPAEMKSKDYSIEILISNKMPISKTSQESGQRFFGTNSHANHAAYLAIDKFARLKLCKFCKNLNNIDQRSSLKKDKTSLTYKMKMKSEITLAHVGERFEKSFNISVL